MKACCFEERLFIEQGLHFLENLHVQGTACRRGARILFKNVHELIPVFLVAEKGDEFDPALGVVIREAARQFFLVGEASLPQEMPYLGLAPLGNEARLADNVFEYFKLFEAVT